MAKIPRQVARREIPSGRVAGAFIPTSLADVGQGIEAQGLGDIGRGVSGLGVALGKIAFAEGTSEASTARGLAGTEIKLLDIALDTNNDPKTYDAELDEVLERIKLLRPESGVGGKQFDDFLEDAIPQWQTGVNIKKIQRTEANIRGDYLLNKQRADANGDLAESNRLTDEAENITGVITPEQAARDRIQSERFVTALNTERAETVVLDAAFAKWQQTGELKEAFKVIAGSGLDDKARLENELKTRVTNRLAEDEIALAQEQEKQRAEINQLIFFDKNYDAANTTIQNSSLTEKDKGILLADSGRRATAAAKGIPIKNDRVEEARLFDLSLKIWNGTISKPDFDTELMENAHKLDDSAYQRIAASASNILKSSQAEAATRASTETRNVLVDFVTEDGFRKFIADSIKGLSPDIAKAFEENANEERQLQFWSLSRYNAEIRQWLEENPDKLGKDFFQFSESLRHVYWNRSIDEIRALRLAREAEFNKLRTRTEGEIEAAAFLRANPLPIIPSVESGLPLITNKAEYDKLPKGARYRDTKGNIVTKRQ